MIFNKIEITNNVNFQIFNESNFWDSMLPRSLNDSRWIDIVTYNFNFQHRDFNSMYGRLKRLSELGVNIRLLFNIQTFSEDDIVLEKIFELSIPVFVLKENHCKIFMSENKCFIGSPNFSKGSENNYESGILIEDTDKILEIRNIVTKELFCNADLLNNDLDLFDDGVEVEYCMEILKKINSEITTLDFKKFVYSEDIFELRWCKVAIKFAERFGFSINKNESISQIIDYRLRNLPIDDNLIFEFVHFSQYLYNELSYFENYKMDLYKKRGRSNYLKEITGNKKSDCL